MKLQTLQILQIFSSAGTWSVVRRCTYPSIHFFVSRSRSVARRVRVQAFVCVVCVCAMCVCVGVCCGGDVCVQCGVCTLCVVCDMCSVVSRVVCRVSCVCAWLCVCWECVGWAFLCFDVVVCWAVSLFVVLACVLGCVLWWVRFFLSCTEHAPMWSFKTFPYVLSKRPCHKGHQRLERTHESVFIVHTGASIPSLLASLSSRVSLSLLLVSLSFFLFSLSNNDNDHSSSRLSLYAQLWLALRARVQRPWPIPCRSDMFASCKKQLPWCFLCKPRATWKEVGLYLCWKWVLCLVVFGCVSMW